MRHSLFITLAASLLLCPAVAMALMQTSPNYTINAGRIVSGGTVSADGAGLNKTGIIIGQGVFIPPGGSSSPNFIIKPGAISAFSAVHNGDVNGDGVVDIIDALLSLKASVGLMQLSSNEVFRGDVAPLVNNVSVGDNKIDVEDTMLILRKAVGLPW